MPYTASSPNLPKNVKAASAKERAQWVNVWNSVYSRAKKDGKSDKEAEAAAFAQANGVLKKREAKMGLITFGQKTKEENGHRFPPAAYAYVPDPNDPETWKIRLWETPTAKETANQVNAAVTSFTADIPARDLAGTRRKMRSAWLRVNKDAKPDDMPETIQLSACFSVRDEEAGVVHRWGKLFEAGDYKAHKFAMTPEEVANVPVHFSPVDLNLQHGPSILDGKLGRLEEVEADNGILFGRVVVPIWLDDAIGDRPFTVSTEWDRATKCLDGLAIEIDPQVEDAVMFAAKRSEGRDPEAEEAAELARIQMLPMPGLDQPIVEKLIETFAKRHDTHSGQSAIQDIHDTAARYGAVCADPNAKMQSKHESTALQGVHDMMTEHGARCSSKESASMPWMFSAIPIVRDSSDEKEKGIMSKLADEVRALLARIERGGSGGGDEDDEADEKTPVPTPTPASNPTETADFAANAEMVRLRNANADLQSRLMQQEAVHFAEKIITEKYAAPSEKDAIVEAYIQAATDDLTSGQVMLSSGKKGSRVDKLAALYSNRPKFSLVDERVQGAVHAALANLDKTVKPGDEEDLRPETIAELANATAMGRATMAKNGAATS